jgi:hypothetical protein
MSFDKIPKVVHVYWGSPTEEMSYLRYMSLLSIKMYCTGWQIKLHIPKKPGGEITWKTGEQKAYGAIRQNYFADALLVADEVVRHDFEDYGFSNSAHEVHKADFLRWQLLAGEGGIWSDLDILYTKSLDELQFDYAPDDTAQIDSIIHIYPQYRAHAIGLLGASPGNAMFAACRDNVSSQSLDTYQAIGSELLNAELRTIWKIRNRYPNLEVANITRNSVYYILPNTIYALYTDMDNPLQFPADSIGCHWFGGHQLSQKFEHDVYGPDAPMPNNTMAHLLRATIAASKKEMP